MLILDWAFIWTHVRPRNKPRPILLLIGRTWLFIMFVYSIWPRQSPFIGLLTNI